MGLNPFGKSEGAEAWALSLMVLNRNVLGGLVVCVLGVGKSRAWEVHQDLGLLGRTMILCICGNLCTGISQRYCRYALLQAREWTYWAFRIRIRLGDELGQNFQRPCGVLSTTLSKLHTRTWLKTRLTDRVMEFAVRGCSSSGPDQRKMPADARCLKRTSAKNPQSGGGGVRCGTVSLYLISRQAVTPNPKPQALET